MNEKSIRAIAVTLGAALGLPFCGATPARSNSDWRTLTTKGELFGQQLGDDNSGSQTNMNGRVVGSERVDGEGSSQIFSFAADGTDRKPLTSSGSNIIPSWSRDGKRILFSSNYEIWVMNSAGGEKRQLTFNTQGGNFAPVESPDGKHIAFAGVRGNNPPEVWVMNVDGTSQKRLTVTPRIPPEILRKNAEPPTFFDTFPPKMRRIERDLPPWIQNNRDKADEATLLVQQMQEHIKANDFEEAEKTVDSILKMMGLSPQAVVQDGPRLLEQSWSSHPTWSADGKRLAYSSSRSGSAQIWVMNANGSGQKQLTHGLGDRFPDANVPCWSFDGKLITFWAGRETKYGDIWVMESDGKNPRRVTHTEVPANSDDPHWAPDGKKIIYGSGPPAKRAMFVVDVKSHAVTPFAKDIQWCDWQRIPGASKTSKKPNIPKASKTQKETKYLAFQIFTYNPDPKMASMGEGGNDRSAHFPSKAALGTYIEDIKTRIGTVGDKQNLLAVILGPISFDHSDAEVTQFIDLAFELALEKNVAVGFHLDDSIFWAKRTDLLSDPKNVESVDWSGTSSTGRRLDWGKEPSEAPPQMCFNSKAVVREVQRRSAFLGRAIQAGVKKLQSQGRPELFAGVIAGWETMIGQDFTTGKYLGYRALLNRGFSRKHPPQDMDAEREKVVQEFIELWTTGLADAGVSPRKIYSHTAFLSRRASNLGDDKDGTDMKHDIESAYSRLNHFAPPSVSFGENHRPGFSTYPQPGLDDDIYAELTKHNQVAWASSEGTNMQPESGPGQTGMNMETYLARMFNHGATLVNLFSWGIGGEANKNMGFRVVTESPEALHAYRKFLKAETLVETKSAGETVEQRLPAKIHKIQDELPAWIQRTGNQSLVEPLMRKLDAALRANDLEQAESVVDSILKLMSQGESKS